TSPSTIGALARKPRRARIRRKTSWGRPPGPPRTTWVARPTTASVLRAKPRAALVLARSTAITTATPSATPSTMRPVWSGRRRRSRRPARRRPRVSTSRSGTSWSDPRPRGGPQLPVLDREDAVGALRDGRAVGHEHEGLARAAGGALEQVEDRGARGV